MIKLSFCQNDPPIGISFWQNTSLVIHILFELILINSPLAQSKKLWDTLYQYQYNRNHTCWWNSWGWKRSSQKITWPLYGAPSTWNQGKEMQACYSWGCRGCHGISVNLISTRGWGADYAPTSLLAPPNFQTFGFYSKLKNWIHCQTKIKESNP